jgi:hypothetical protein
LDHTRLQSQEGKDLLVQHTLKVLATRSTPSDNHYDCLASALYTAAEKLLPRRARSEPQWFQKNALILRGKIEVRNRMFDEYQRNPRCASIKMKLQRSRRALQQAVRKAKDDWIIMQTDRVNDGVCGATGSKAAWDAVNALKRGLELKKRPAPIRMKFVDGSSASTAEDNAEVFARHFDGLYGCRAVYDDSVLFSLPER